MKVALIILTMLSGFELSAAELSDRVIGVWRYLEKPMELPVSVIKDFEISKRSKEDQDELLRLYQQFKASIRLKFSGDKLVEEEVVDIEPFLKYQRLLWKGTVELPQPKFDKKEMKEMSWRGMISTLQDSHHINLITLKSDLVRNKTRTLRVFLDDKILVIQENGNEFDLLERVPMPDKQKEKAEDRK